MCRSNPFDDQASPYERELEAYCERSRVNSRDHFVARNDHREYRPCEMPARRIGEGGYDGIRYPSAMNPGGFNVVLFDPELATVGESRLVEIKGVGVTYRTFIDN